MAETNFGREGFIWLTAHSPLLKEFRAGIDEKATEEYCLQACSPWLAQLLSYGIQDHLPRDGTYND